MLSTMCQSGRRVAFIGTTVPYIVPMNSPEIFNRHRILARKSRAVQQFSLAEQFIYQLMVDDIVERCALLVRQFAHALLIAPPWPELKFALMATEKFTDITCVWNDFAAHEAPNTPPATYDCIISCAELAWINDVQGYLRAIHAGLKPDGMFLAQCVGGNTLTELRQCLIQAESELSAGVQAHIHPMLEVRTLGSLLQQAKFALPVVDVETHTVRYANIMRVFEDIRIHGAGYALSGATPQLTRSVLARALALYAEQFSHSDGKYYATIDILCASGWHPHASQQQPLKPGSAKVSLTSVLPQY